jgi:hypothetical protein
MGMYKCFDMGDKPGFATASGYALANISSQRKFHTWRAHHLRRFFSGSRCMMQTHA